MGIVEEEQVHVVRAESAQALLQAAPRGRRVVGGAIERATDGTAAGVAAG